MAPRLCLGRLLARGQQEVRGGSRVPDAHGRLSYGRRPLFLFSGCDDLHTGGHYRHTNGNGHLRSLNKYSVFGKSKRHAGTYKLTNGNGHERSLNKYCTI